MQPVTNAANPMMGQVKGQSPTNRAANTTSLVTFEPNQLSDGLLGLIESSQQQVGLSRDQLAQVVEMSSKDDPMPTKGPFVFEIEGETLHNIKLNYPVGGAQVEINLEELFQNHVESITTCIEKIKGLLTEVFNFLRILSDQKLIKLDDPNSSSKFEPATQFFGLKLDDASFIDGFKKGQINIGDIRFGLTSIRTFTGLFLKKYDQLIEEQFITDLTDTFNFSTNCFTKCEDEDEDEDEDGKVYYEVNAATFTEEVLKKIDKYKKEFLMCIENVSDGSVTGNLLQQIHHDSILNKRPTDLADMKRYENEAFTEFCYLGLNFINKQLEGICEEVGAANKYYKFAAQSSNDFYDRSVRQLQDLIATHIKPKFDPSYKEVKRKRNSVCYTGIFSDRSLEHIKSLYNTLTVHSTKAAEDAVEKTANSVFMPVLKKAYTMGIQQGKHQTLATLKDKAPIATRLAEYRSGTDLADIGSSGQISLLENGNGTN